MDKQRQLLPAPMAVQRFPMPEASLKELSSLMDFKTRTKIAETSSKDAQEPPKIRRLHLKKNRSGRSRLQKPRTKLPISLSPDILRKPRLYSSTIFKQSHQRPQKPSFLPQLRPKEGYRTLTNHLSLERIGFQSNPIHFLTQTHINDIAKRLQK